MTQPSARVGGVDGCPGGWIVAFERPTGGIDLQLVPEAAGLLDLDLDLLAIDIPIGLPQTYHQAGASAIVPLVTFLVVPAGAPCSVRRPDRHWPS